MLTKNPSRHSRPTFTDQEALLFHSQGRPGKLEVVARLAADWFTRHLGVGGSAYAG